MSEKKNKKNPCADCAGHATEIEEYKQGWQRAVADYQNLQNTMIEWRTKTREMCEADILEKFIPVYENFKKAFAMAEGETDDSWRAGIGHIMKQFGDVLKSYAVMEIPTVGETVDLNCHEVVGETETADQKPGVIVQEVAGGYKKGGRVIIPARVVVAKPLLEKK